MAVLASAWAFLFGVLRRFYWWLPSIVLDPFDYNERYIEPALGRNVDLPAFVFPLAFGLGITLAATLTYHEQRVKALSNVVFEIRQASIAFSTYNHTRPAQPLTPADIVVHGRLDNKASERAPVDDLSLDWQQRRWCVWQKVGEVSLRRLRNQLKANIDPYYHELAVEGRSRSRAISEIWACISTPVNLRDRLERHHRVRVIVKAAGHWGSATYAALDVKSAFEFWLSDFERRIWERKLASGEGLVLQVPTTDEPEDGIPE